MKPVCMIQYMQKIFTMGVLRPVWKFQIKGFSKWVKYLCS